MALYIRQARGETIEPRHLQKLSHVPQAIEEALEQGRRIEELARRSVRANDFLYLGRGINYPIALEGALKLKEISYIHAEGYPAGEMKHGPIALIDEDLPVVAIATAPRLRQDLSNLQEASARRPHDRVTDRPTTSATSPTSDAVRPSATVAADRKRRALHCSLPIGCVAAPRRSARKPARA